MLVPEFDMNPVALVAGDLEGVIGAFGLKIDAARRCTFPGKVRETVRPELQGAR